jgi:hypothetical protein
VHAPTNISASNAPVLGLARLLNRQQALPVPVLHGLATNCCSKQALYSQSLQHMFVHVLTKIRASNATVLRIVSGTDSKLCQGLCSMVVLPCICMNASIYNDGLQVLNSCQTTHLLHAHAAHLPFLQQHSIHCGPLTLSQMLGTTTSQPTVVSVPPILYSACLA